MDFDRKEFYYYIRYLWNNWRSFVSNAVFHLSVTSVVLCCTMLLYNISHSCYITRHHESHWRWTFFFQRKLISQCAFKLLRKLHLKYELCVELPAVLISLCSVVFFCFLVHNFLFLLFICNSSLNECWPRVHKLTAKLCWWVNFTPCHAMPIRYYTRLKCN